MIILPIQHSDIIRKALGPVRLHILCPHPHTHEHGSWAFWKHISNNSQSHCWGDLVGGCSPLKTRSQVLLDCPPPWDSNMGREGPWEVTWLKFYACDFQKELNEQTKTEWEGKRCNLKIVNLWNSVVKVLLYWALGFLVTAQIQISHSKISSCPFWSCHPSTLNWALKTVGTSCIFRALTLVQRVGRGYLCSPCSLSTVISQGWECPLDEESLLIMSGSMECLDRGTAKAGKGRKSPFLYSCAIQYGSH